MNSSNKGIAFAAISLGIAAVASADLTLSKPVSIYDFKAELPTTLLSAAKPEANRFRLEERKTPKGAIWIISSLSYEQYIDAKTSNEFGFSFRGLGVQRNIYPQGRDVNGLMYVVGVGAIAGGIGAGGGAFYNFKASDTVSIRAGVEINYYSFDFGGLDRAGVLALPHLSVGFRL